MKCCGRTSLRDACCRLHLRLIVFCVFSAIWPLRSSSIASVRTERSEPRTAPGSGWKLHGDDNPGFTLCCARQYWNSGTSDTKRGRFRIDSHVKCWIFTIIGIILPGLCFKPEKEVTVLFIGPISWQLYGTTGMFQNKMVPSLLLACAWLSFSSHDLKQFSNSSSDRRGNASESHQKKKRKKKRLVAMSPRFTARQEQKDAETAVNHSHTHLWLP